MLRIFAASCLLASFLCPAFAADAGKTVDPPDFTVERIAFAIGVSSRAPVGQATAFPSAVDTVFCWSKLKARRPPARVKHVWSHDGSPAGEYLIDLKHRFNRVWTYKRVRPGLWRVDITDEKGKALAVATFLVRP